MNPTWFPRPTPPLSNRQNPFFRHLPCSTLTPCCVFFFSIFLFTFPDRQTILQNTRTPLFFFCSPVTSTKARNSSPLQTSFFSIHLFPFLFNVIPNSLHGRRCSCSFLSSESLFACLLFLCFLRYLFGAVLLNIQRTGWLLPPIFLREKKLPDIF